MRNPLVSLQTEQGVLKEVKDVKKGVKEYFEERFRKINRPRLT